MHATPVSVVNETMFILSLNSHRVSPTHSPSLTGATRSQLTYGSNYCRDSQSISRPRQLNWATMQTQFVPLHVCVSGCEAQTSVSLLMCILLLVHLSRVQTKQKSGGGITNLESCYFHEFDLCVFVWNLQLCYCCFISLCSIFIQQNFHCVNLCVQVAVAHKSQITQAYFSTLTGHLEICSSAVHNW